MEKKQEAKKRDAAKGATKALSEKKPQQDGVQFYELPQRIRDAVEKIAKRRGLMPNGG